ncbi:MAG: virulence RhuM family protein [Clostridia bacterium]|nr:virulence RhuM family protein [Clostridia bacterium]
MTQEQISKLFDKAKSTINEHIKNIYEEGELKEEVTMRKFGISEFSTKPTNYYNLEMIIAIGYRVKSVRGTQFRIWANGILKEYLTKGYNLNVKRFKNEGGGVYFEEVLEKIRDIRSSEKVFWRKILDIYATSVDYDAKEETTKEFFRTVQNKMHYATHENTAAEVIFNRVDSEKENIGLTNFKGSVPTKAETEVAKNYLTLEELDFLNKLVTAYLDVAEVNALKMHAMTMSDWVKELDSFLTMTHNDILNNKGTISHEQALEKAHEEYDKYMKSHLTQAEKDYLEIMEVDIKKLK